MRRSAFLTLLAACLLAGEATATPIWDSTTETGYYWTDPGFLIDNANNELPDPMFISTLQFGCYWPGTGTYDALIAVWSGWPSDPSWDINDDLLAGWNVTGLESGGWIVTLDLSTYSVVLQPGHFSLGYDASVDDAGLIIAHRDYGMYPYDLQYDIFWTADGVAPDPDGSWWFGGDPEGSFYWKVEGEVVPEPTSLALVAVAGFGLLWWRRRSH